MYASVIVRMLYTHDNRRFPNVVPVESLAGMERLYSAYNDYVQVDWVIAVWLRPG